MSAARTTCIVCSSPLPTGYRGRPRVVCSDRCYGRRRTILSQNATKLAEAKDLCRKLVAQVSPWPELFVATVKLFDGIGNTGPELTDFDRGRLNILHGERDGEIEARLDAVSAMVDHLEESELAPCSQATERRPDLADVPKRLYGGDGPWRD